MEETSRKANVTCFQNAAGLLQAVLCVAQQDMSCGSIAKVIKVSVMMLCKKLYMNAQSLAVLPSEEVWVVPVEPSGPDSDELKDEALFCPTAWLDEDTPLLPSNLHKIQ